MAFREERSRGGGRKSLVRTASLGHEWRHRIQVFETLGLATSDETVATSSRSMQRLRAAAP
jgi:hypothetical protein